MVPIDKICTKIREKFGYKIKKDNQTFLCLLPEEFNYLSFNSNVQEDLNITTFYKNMKCEQKLLIRHIFEGDEKLPPQFCIYHIYSSKDNFNKKQVSSKEFILDFNKIEYSILLAKQRIPTIDFKVIKGIIENKQWFKMSEKGGVLAMVNEGQVSFKFI